MKTGQLDLDNIIKILSVSKHKRARNSLNIVSLNKHIDLRQTKHSLI